MTTAVLVRNDGDEPSAPTAAILSAAPLGVGASAAAGGGGQMMKKVVDEGTGTPAQLGNNIGFAGETGTASVGVAGQNLTQPWFIGFAPVQNQGRDRGHDRAIQRRLRRHRRRADREGSRADAAGGGSIGRWHRRPPTR